MFDWPISSPQKTTMFGFLASAQQTVGKSMVTKSPARRTESHSNRVEERFISRDSFRRAAFATHNRRKIFQADVGKIGEISHTWEARGTGNSDRCQGRATTSSRNASRSGRSCSLHASF